MLVGVLLRLLQAIYWLLVVRADREAPRMAPALDGHQRQVRGGLGYGAMRGLRGGAVGSDLFFLVSFAMSLLIHDTKTRPQTIFRLRLRQGQDIWEKAGGWSN